MARNRIPHQNYLHQDSLGSLFRYAQVLRTTLIDTNLLLMDTRSFNERSELSNYKLNFSMSQVTNCYN